MYLACFIVYFGCICVSDDVLTSKYIKIHLIHLACKSRMYWQDLDVLCLHWGCIRCIRCIKIVFGLYCLCILIVMLFYVIPFSSSWSATSSSDIQVTSFNPSHDTIRYILAENPSDVLYLHNCNCIPGSTQGSHLLSHALACRVWTGNLAIASLMSGPLGPSHWATTSLGQLGKMLMTLYLSTDNPSRDAAYGLRHVPAHYRVPGPRPEGGFRVAVGPGVTSVSLY